MNTPDQDILNDVFARTRRRRALLPLWIKIFIWIFFVFSFFSIIGFPLALAGSSFEVSIFGLETNDPLSVTGFGLLSLFLAKGFVSYALWTEKNYGVKVAIVDAMVSIVLCICVMVYDFSNGHYDFRIELIPLFFYLRKLRRIREEWESEYALQEQPVSI